MPSEGSNIYYTQGIFFELLFIIIILTKKKKEKKQLLKKTYLRPQNLRDQASRLEKLQESSANTILEESSLEISSRNTQTLTERVNCDSENNQNNRDQESQYANLSSTYTLHLHQSQRS